MRDSHVALLRCLECSSDLEIGSVRERGRDPSEIELGVLRCTACRHEYPILQGVGVFFGAAVAAHFLSEPERRQCESLGIQLTAREQGLSADQRRTKLVTDNWSYQWNEIARWGAEDFAADDFKGRRAFLEFIRIDDSEYRDRRVMIWCGGSGREAYHVSRMSPSLLVVNDIGLGIYSVRELVDSKCEVLLIRGDLLKSPVRPRSMDISVCDHALQHIVDWRGGFESLVEAVRPGGLVGVCVYSHENNVLMTHIIEPSKRILHLVPLRLLRLVSIVPALFIYALIHLFYVPLGRVVPRRVARKLPLYEHMIFWSTSDLDFLMMSCFDLLHAPISYHFRREEMLELSQQAGLSCRTLENTHGTTWSMVVRIEK